MDILRNQYHPPKVHFDRFSGLPSEPFEISWIRRLEVVALPFGHKFRFMKLVTAVTRLAGRAVDGGWVGVLGGGSGIFGFGPVSADSGRAQGGSTPMGSCPRVGAGCPPSLVEIGPPGGELLQKNTEKWPFRCDGKSGEDKNS